ncbi:MAG: FliA/WhiG family RNA polymerase sigma factor [Lachnospiraceae bacterium]|nr:FliA/WhiG family RNA polymerase sigma factor [Lachnospiraceae bacterium]
MNEAEKAELWASYSKNRSSEIREKIIIEYAPLVKVVAGHLHMYLGHNVEYDDLVGYGVFGLIDAVDKYDTDKEVKFETYASLRIRGSILDHIRKMDWIPRTLRQKQKKMDSVIKEIETETGKTATDQQIAERLDISVEELQEWYTKMKGTTLISLNEYIDQGSEIQMDASRNSHFETPEKVMENQDIKRILAESMENLTEKERKVILFYYYEELTLKEISRILEVSESRVSQLHTRALEKLRNKLGDSINILFY